MESLLIETGVVTYNLNDQCTVSFNPTDTFFAERLFEGFSTLDRKQQEYRNADTERTENVDVFKLARERDGEMREIINHVFEQDVCTPVFGSMNVYALADGLPLWANLMLAVIDKMDEALTKERKAMNPRVEKYTRKYHK